MRRRLFIALFAAAALLCAVPKTGGTQTRGRRIPIIVVVPRASPLGDVSLADLRRVYGGGAATTLRPLNLPPGVPERIAFDRRVLAMEPAQVARFWIDRRIRGQSGPPRVLPTGQLVVRIVARVPDTIGYALEMAIVDGVKVVRVEGKKPGEPGYPLFVEEGAR